VSGRLLDAGCGPGWPLEEFARSGFHAVGVDASATAVEEARSRGLDARRLDLERDPLKSILESGAEGFDAVVALEVLEHLADPLAAIDELGSVLKPGGLLVVSLPNEAHLLARLRMLFGALPFGGHDDPHLRHFDRRLARRLFEAARCRVADERPVSIIPPRWRALRAILGPAHVLFPGCWAMATLYLLQGGGDGR
jgi:2-polyprenyl-3-methyl-5-hydroxy-6-metoxy-1,4-benzoquinol methylase